MDKENLINYAIEERIRCIITEEVNKEINKKVDNFRKELEDRKDKYIAEVIKGIKIEHEQDHYNNMINYRVTFENIYRIEEVQDERNKF